MSDSTKHVPASSRWEFDASVADVFDDMLARSIPQHEVMRSTVEQIARRFATAGHGPVTDLGSSRGEALAPLVRDFGSARDFYAAEVSPPMVTVLRERFRGPISEGWFHLLDGDLRDERARRWGGAGSVTLSVLTLQFVPINYRQAIVQRAHDLLAPGGAFVLVEKVLGSTSLLDELMVEDYHLLKGAHGYGREEIERKRLALEGVLVPVTAAWNEDLLRQAGFRHVDCFWRWMNFAGWLAVRG